MVARIIGLLGGFEAGGIVGMLVGIGVGTLVGYVVVAVEARKEGLFSLAIDSAALGLVLASAILVKKVYF